MIKLELQMFGGGSSGGGGAGGGGTNASKSTSKQAVSSNAPGSGHGKGGGRRMDGAPVKRDELREQPVTTQQRHAEPKHEEPKTRKSSESETTVKRIIPTERYTVHSRRGELQESNISGNDLAKAGYRYDQRDDVWRDRHGKEVKVRIAKRR